jgi:acetylglutamate kinase
VSALDDAAARAAVLVEALPYIRRFSGAVMVVKYGGSVPSGAGEVDRALGLFAEDVVLLASVGVRVVVVHGGGPQIGALMERLGKVPEFRDGLRVTDAETLEIARMVLVGKVNREIVSAINCHGPLAVGLSGEDAGLLEATPRPGGLGFVGDVEVVQPAILERLLAQALVPVVATIATDSTGQAYNLNADAVAGAVAGALHAAKLLFLTDVEGIRRDPEDPSSRLSRLHRSALEDLLAQGALRGGMVPKARAVLDALRSGVPEVHVLDGRRPHVLLLELLSDAGVGTMVVDDSAVSSGAPALVEGVSR